MAANEGRLRDREELGASTALCKVQSGVRPLP